MKGNEDGSEILNSDYSTRQIIRILDDAELKKQMKPIWFRIGGNIYYCQ